MLCLVVFTVLSTDYSEMFFFIQKLHTASCSLLITEYNVF